VLGTVQLEKMQGYGFALWLTTPTRMTAQFLQLTQPRCGHL